MTRSRKLVCFILTGVAAGGVAFWAAAAGPRPAQKATDGPTKSSIPGAEPNPSQRYAPDPALEYARARAQVEQTIAAQPKALSLRMQAAEFYMRAGDHPAALPHLRVATRLSEDQFFPWLALGDAATLAGEPQLAERAYTRAKKLDARHPLLFRGYGQLLISRKRLAEAQNVLERGLALHPKDVEIRTTLGNLFLIRNKPGRAIEVLEPAVKAAPARPDLHYLIAESYERDLKLERAISHLRDAVRLDPAMDSAWGRLGLYLVNLTRYAEARAPLQRAIELRPDEPHYHWALGDTYLLDSGLQNGFALAAEAYRKALKLSPHNEKALYSFAMALTRRGKEEDLREAAELLERLVRLQPQDINAHYKLAETYRRLSRPEDANKHLKVFQRLSAQHRSKLRNLYQGAAFRDTFEEHMKRGREFMARKRPDLAVKSFEVAVARNGKSTEARQALARARRATGQQTGGIP